MNIDIIKNVLCNVDSKTLTAFLITNKEFYELINLFTFKVRVLDYLFKKVNSTWDRAIKRMDRHCRFDPSEYFERYYYNVYPGVPYTSPTQDMLRSEDILIDKEIPFKRRVLRKKSPPNEELLKALNAELDLYMAR